MEQTLKISYGKPYPLGASYVGNGQVNFSGVVSTDEQCGVILYDKKHKTEERLSFCCSNKVGNIRCMKVSGIDPLKYDYNFYVGDEVFYDPYARVILGNETWGKIPDKLRAGIYSDEYDWEGDKSPLTPYHDSIIYLLHVRGFTKHKSSNVSHPGTYEGIIEKIPYLKDLGITAIEMMPVYNFVELEPIKNKEGEFALEPFDEVEPKLNYWGYKESFYFAPKCSYSAKGTPAEIGFKDMVKALHKEGIEVILQFFFPDTIKQGYIIEVLRYWMQEYHIDGFHLMGNKLPLALLGTEPMFTNTKIICESFPLDEIYERGFLPTYKNLALCTDRFMYDMRRLLKADEGMVAAALDYMKNVPEKLGDVHYMTHGNTFTLMDLVSFDRKHNEPNGENNRDGSPYNGSWNCGYEGPTTRQSVRKLRLRQIKNAIILNMLSKSTPLIVAGDEFGNSQNGNNNPYCQDSTVTWLNWNNLTKYSQIYDFMKSMIALRKDHKILHTRDSFKMSDYLQCSYPDLSFHSSQLWKVDNDILSRQFAMLYCGEYASENDFIYVAVNLHWTAHEFAIPKLPKKYKWKIVADTNEKTDIEVKDSDHAVINVKERSIVIMLGKA